MKNVKGVIIHEAEMILLSKGYTKSDISKMTQNEAIKLAKELKWYMHMSLDDMASVGVIDCLYIHCRLKSDQVDQWVKVDK